MMKNLSSKKGFFLVSPFLGIFFFMITVGITMSFVSTNDQAIKTASAGAGGELMFVSYAIQADAFDVYLQNVLQAALDNYVPPATTDPTPLPTQLENLVNTILDSYIMETYQTIYSNISEVSCDIKDKLTSEVYVKFNGPGYNILNCTADLSNIPTFTPEEKTAVWPFLSQYGLDCSSEEPPMKAGVAFTSRWYYLNAHHICEIAPLACQDPCY